MNDIQPAVQNGAELVLYDGRIVGLGLRKFAAFHALIELSRRHMKLVAVYGIPEGVILRDDDGVQLFDVFLRQVGIGICGDNKVSHGIDNPFLLSSCILY